MMKRLSDSECVRLAKVESSLRHLSKGIPGGPLSESECVTLAEVESFQRHFDADEGCLYPSVCSAFIKRDLWSLEARGILRLTRNDDGSHNAFLTDVGRKVFEVQS